MNRFMNDFMVDLKIAIENDLEDAYVDSFDAITENSVLLNNSKYNAIGASYLQAEDEIIFIELADTMDNFVYCLNRVAIFRAKNIDTVIEKITEYVKYLLES